MEPTNFASFTAPPAKIACLAAAMALFVIPGALSAQTLDAFSPSANVTVKDIDVLSDGKILFCGDFSQFNGQARRGIVRVNPDGTLDTSFPVIDTAFNPIENAAVQPDGKIIISGPFSTINGVSRPRVARLNPDGTLDTTFNAGLTSGNVTRPFILPDGKILVPANSSTAGIFRANPDGSKDTTFQAPAFTGSTIVSIARQPDGRILIAGSFTHVGGTPRMGIARLNENGSFDPSFNANASASVFWVDVAGDGRIYASGAFTSIGGQARTYIARLNADGSADPSFNNPQASGPTNPEMRKFVVQPNGKILVTGSFTTIGGVNRKHFARLNGDGTLDTSFRDMSVGADAFSTPSTVQRQADGKILLAGNFTTIDGQTRNRIARIVPNDPLQPGSLVNIATRLRVEAGDNALIAGFIVTGDVPKRVLLRGIGPSLPVSDKLADPTLELVLPDGTKVFNNNWRDTQEADVAATTIPPQNELEAAIVATLAPGFYTAIVRGQGGGTGVALAEVYDLNTAASSTLANISTRGLVQTGENVMIGGLIVGGEEPARVLIRAIGPSLAEQKVAGALQDTTLELVDKNGVTITNDDWRTTQEAEIIDTTVPPSDDRESAIVATLVPDFYTAIVRGKNNSTGVALVEAYKLQ